MNKTPGTESLYHYNGLRMVLFLEPAGLEDVAWVAIALDYDVVAQGKSPHEALEGLGYLLEAEAVIRISHDQLPTENLRPAPDFYFNRFNVGKERSRG